MIKLRRSIKKSFEINRISSLRKNKYSISTVATQADLDKGSITVERKETKYRNQELSDVESQILGIELIDVCSDAYVSINDWASLKKRNNQLKNSVKYNDRLLSPRIELATVKVNDYVAFKNCMNYELECGNTTTTDDPVLLSASRLSSVKLHQQRMLIKNSPTCIKEVDSETEISASMSKDVSGKTNLTNLSTEKLNSTTEEFDKQEYYSKIATSKPEASRKKRLRSGSVKACVETGHAKNLMSSSTSEIEMMKVNGMSVSTFSINESTETLNEQNSDKADNSNSDTIKSVRFSDDISFI
jgi:hypothetical protein